MQVVNRPFPKTGRGDCITLYDFADLHFGSATCAKKELIEWVGRVKKDPMGYWFGGGDFFDAIFVGDKRFDMRLSKFLDADLWNAADEDVGQFRLTCLDALLEIFWPIMDKCIGLQVGNHEETVAARGQSSLIQEFVTLYQRDCKKAGTKANPWVAQLSYNTIYLLQFHRGESQPGKKSVGQQVRIFSTHGAGGAATVGGRVNRIESVLAWLPGCHAYICHHFHDALAHPRAVLNIVSGSKPHVEQFEPRVMLAPSFLRTYDEKHDTYAAKRLYPPSVIGCARVRIWPYGERIQENGHDTTKPKLEVPV